MEKEIKHILTIDDLIQYPELFDSGLKVGDEIGLPREFQVFFN